MWRVLLASTAFGLVLAHSPAWAQSGSVTGVSAPQSAPSPAVQDIDGYVQREMQRQRLPGVAVGVYRNGVPVHLKGYGLADLEWNVPMGPDSLMQTGSLGKQFVAAAVLKLAEDGLLDIDGDIRRHFPEGPAEWSEITVANLLSHTSGLGDYDAPGMTAPGGAFDYRRDFTEDQLAAAIAALPPVAAPNAEWQYNNANYVLLGILIHRVTGQTWGDYLKTTFLAPLAMTSTRVISDLDIIPRRASGYELRSGRLRNQQWVSATFNSTADGTIYSTIEDMGRWERALSSGTLLSPESMRRMWTPVVLADGRPNAQGYGFGWNITQLNGQQRIAHNGAWQGFTSNMTRYPEAGLSVVVFANLDSSAGRPDLIARVVAGLVEPNLMPAPSVALPDDPDRAHRLRNFLLRAISGEDLSNDFSPGVGYDPQDHDLIADLTSSLPEGWLNQPMILVRETSRPDGSGRYSYRIGPTANSRLFTVALSASGRIAGYGVAADPDGR